MVSSARVDRLIANSRLVAWRIKHYWNRQAEVMPPPVATEYFTPGGDRGDALLTVAALVPYKRVEVAIEVAKRLGRPLEIVGTGPRMPQLRRLAGPDVRFLGWLDRAELRDVYRRAAAVLVPNIEDFGMVTVEALACGTPVVMRPDHEAWDGANPDFPTLDGTYFSGGAGLSSTVAVSMPSVTAAALGTSAGSA